MATENNNPTFDEFSEIESIILGRGEEQDLSPQEEQTDAPQDQGASEQAQAKSQAPESQPPQSVDDFQTLFGEKWKTPKELKSHLEQLETLKSEYEGKLNALKPFEGVSEFVKGLIEFEQKGGSPQVYLQVNALDFQKMEAKEVLKYKYLIDNAEIVSKLGQEKALKLFEKEFNKNYPLDPDMASEEDIEISQILLEKEALSARKFLESQKKQALTPPQQQQAELSQQYLKEVENALKEFKHLEFDLGNNSKFNYGITDKAQIEQILKKPESLFDLFASEDGKDDVQSFRNAVSVMLNYKQIVKSAYDQGKNDGVEAQLKKLKNPQTQAKGTAPKGGAGKSEMELIEDVIMGKTKN